MPQFSISTHPSSDAPSFSKISQPSGQKQQNGKQCCLPPLSFKISRKDTSFHISFNSLGSYLSPECLLIFLSNCYIPPCTGKIFKFMEFRFLEIHALGRRKLPIPPRHHSFEKLFLPTIERSWGNYELLYQKMTWNIRFFIFSIICNFFKWDGLTVL